MLFPGRKPVYETGRVLILLCAVFFPLALAGEGVFTSPVGGGADSVANVPWTDKGFRNADANFQFAIVGDRSGGARRGVFASAMEKLNLLQPEFVLSVGDLIQGYTDDRDVINQRHDEIDDIVHGLEMRFFRVVGNHDMGNSIMKEVYRERYGHPYYHFIYKDVLFLVVSTEDDSKTGIGETQIAYMKKAIGNNENARWTFVFMHKPLFIERGIIPWHGMNRVKHEAWLRIERALAARPYTVFAGHEHKYASREKHGQSYIGMATTGGSSGLKGRRYGEFDHIAWVTMTDEGPIIANLMLRGIHGVDVR